MQRRFCIFLCAALVLWTLPAKVEAQGVCPACYKNTQDPDLKKKPRDGTGPEENVVTILITGDWDVTPGVTHDLIWNAVTQTIAAWNAADPTGPHIQLAQGDNYTDVSLYITKKKLDPGTFAEIGVPIKSSFRRSGPLELALADDALSRTLDDLKGQIEHEFGHGIKGLADTNAWLEGIPFPIPGSCINSVMNQSGLDGKRKPEWNTPSAADVARTVQWRTNRANCTEKATDKAKDKVYFDYSPAPLDSYTQARHWGTCQENWTYTNWYVWFDGWQYIGTSYELISPPCPVTW